MAYQKKFTDRLADQAKSREEFAERMRNRTVRPQTSGAQQTKPKTKTIKPVVTQLAQTRPQRPWAKVCIDNENLKYQSRTTGETLHLQPWAKGLANSILTNADLGGLTLCLIWPAKMTSLPLLHAFGTMARLCNKDLRGLRVLLYPGTHACRTSLGSVLVNRQLLSVFFRTLFVQKNGSTELKAHTTSEAVHAALEALNNLTLHTPDAPNPSLSELIPTFVFDANQRAWTTLATNPLERTLSKVERLHHRRDLRNRVGHEWETPGIAPDSLMVMHHSAKKDSWRMALTDPALKGLGKPEVFLLDATESAMKTSYSAVTKIPDFLLYAKKADLADVGTVVVTDDPKIFFILRAQLRAANLQFSTKIWAAEADSEDALLTAKPKEDGWQPAPRSNANFSVGIVDRDAAQIALKLQKLSRLSGDEGSAAYQALHRACLYVLKLSNIPAGYRDLTALSTESEGSDFVSQQNAWVPVRLSISAALDSGALNAMRGDVEHVIKQTEKLIDDWNDATLMASCMLAEVKKHAFSNRKNMALVLPSKRYILFANSFLKRKLGGDWVEVEPFIEWHTLSAVGRTLIGDEKGRHFVFVGSNTDVLRILLTHPDVPHGTTVLIAYQQADSALKTLSSMKEVEEFKPYRGRIGLLMQELERRLSEIPNPIAINKLREMSLLFKFDDGPSGEHGGEQAYYKFELEGGGRAYSSGWVYRYVPDEDPPFRRVAASTIHQGDFIFDMSDELRAKLESSLELNGIGSSTVNPERILLKLYHDDIKRRCGLLFKVDNRAALAREIQAKMVEIDASATTCPPERVSYWLALQTEGDTRPHAARESKYFKVFCKALDMTDEDAERNWNFVKNARAFNQHLGRQLVARYAEILFQPESAATYRKVPEDVIRNLQQEALRSIYRVEKVEPPSTRVIE